MVPILAEDQRRVVQAIYKVLTRQQQFRACRTRLSPEVIGGVISRMRTNSFDSRCSGSRCAMGVEMTLNGSLA
jgi:hypothetical protein